MNNVKKHAYLIVANTNWKVVAKCMELIDDPRNDIFLLIDKKAKIKDKDIDAVKAMCTQSNVFAECAIVNWGGTHKSPRFCGC